MTSLGDFNDGTTEFDGAAREKPVGRRRRPMRPLDDDESAGASAAGGPGASAPPRPGGENGQPVQGFAAETEAAPQAALPRSPVAMDDDDDDGIPVIPDLEDDGPSTMDGPALVNTIAAAPQAGARVQAITELDAQITSTLPSAAEVGVDLGVLAKLLHPQDAVTEADEEWTFDRLVTSVSKELREEEKMSLQREERLNRLEAAAAAVPVFGEGGATVASTRGTAGVQGRRGLATLAQGVEAAVTSG
mmetsp:Transcript_28794/g.84381  ORF Transcript_28794/g.84381 Transcript_28794/m.84381 type:complete len:247 (-) Transcript_28794:310-1050(-)